MSVQQSQGPPSNGNGKSSPPYLMILAILITWALSTLTTYATGLSNKEQGVEVGYQVAIAKLQGDVNTMRAEQAAEKERVDTLYRAKGWK
jgi:hypothetical protein